MNQEAMREALLAWYDANKRDLPWRRTRDPYAIWLSEVMLQQTTVATVTNRWTRFLQRWPTLADLAAASEEDVVHEWTGLGYYSRARNLHRAARATMERFGGSLPRTAGELRSLPGIGVYTAAAIASIAFDEPVAVVDTNVERVIARLAALDVDVRSRVGRASVAKGAAAMLDRERAGDFNQAMMELGARVCTPAAPRCDKCPLSGGCEALARSLQESLPRRAPKAAIREAREVGILLWRAGRLLVVRRSEGALKGMWEIPRLRLNEGQSQEEGVAALLEQLGEPADPDELGEVAEFRHSIMRERISLRVLERHADALAVWEEQPDRQWITLAGWERLPKGSTQQRLLELLKDRLAGGAGGQQVLDWGVEGGKKTGKGP